MNDCVVLPPVLEAVIESGYEPCCEVEPVSVAVPTPGLKVMPLGRDPLESVMFGVGFPAARISYVAP